MNQSPFALALAMLFVGACHRHAEPTATSKPVAVPAREAGRCLVAEQASKYDVLFTASPEQVRSIFVGWREPVAPRMAMRRNPFTGKDEMARTTEPPETDAGPAAALWDLRPDEIPEDAGYEGYLESRVPPEVRALRHVTAKSVLLYPPSGCASALPLLRVPDALAKVLRDASDEDEAKLAARVQGKDGAFDGWSIADVTAFFREIRAMLRASGAATGLYFLPV